MGWERNGYRSSERFSFLLVTKKASVLDDPKGADIPNRDEDEPHIHQGT